VKRVVTGFVLAALTLSGVLFAPSGLFWAVLLALAAVAAGEMRELVAGGAKRGGSALLMIVAAPLVSTGLSPLAWPGPSLALVAAALAFAAAAVLSRGRGTGSAIRGFLLSAYLGLTIGFIGATFELSAPDGRSALLVGLITVYSGDTLAYYGGRAFGRTKLAPKISPGKTREGALFGLAASGLAFVFAAQFLLGATGAVLPFAAGVAIGAAGMVGDLIASAMKRAAGMKDSGTIFPGHGGVLDRLDSLLLAAPVLHVLVRLIGPASP